jgi:hypothetical protein
VVRGVVVLERLGDAEVVGDRDRTFRLGHWRNLRGPGFR